VLIPRDKAASEQRIVDSLAEHSDESPEEIARLYHAEEAGLAQGARITGFLPVLAIRNVRAVLRQRRKRALALAQAAAGPVPVPA
jgi:hypothetical protein